MDRAKLDQWGGQGILVLVLGILIFSPLVYGAVRTTDFVVVQLAVCAILLLWIFRLWISPRPVLFWPPICWAVLAFIGYAIFRHQTAPVEYAARLELIKVFTYAFLFLAIVNNLPRQETAQFISFTLILLAFALSIFAIYQFITHNPRVWSMLKPEGYSIRGSATFINPNTFAGFLEMILPVALAFTLLSRFSHAKKIAIGYAALVIVAGISSTLSRGGWISAGAMVVIFFILLLFHGNSRLIPAIALAILLVLGISFVAKAHQSQRRFEQLMQAGTLKDDRVKYWNSAIQLWHENIWLGTGPAHYDVRYRQYRPEGIQDRPQYVHNDYLNTLADWGIVGLGIVVGFIALFYAGVFKTWRFVQRSSNDFGSKSSNKAAFVFGGALGVLAIIFHSFFDFNMHIPANAIVLFTLMALVTTYIRFATERFWSSIGIARKILFTLIGFAGIFYLGTQGVRQLREETLLHRAAEQAEYSDAKLDLLKQAFAVEPKNSETAYAIGEIYRGRAFTGMRGYEALTQEAMTWFQRSIALNPFDPFSYTRYGMCLDWLGKNNEAGKYFADAKRLDPNGYYTAANEGWHLLQLGDYTGAKKQFERSEQLMPNPLAESYLEIIEQKLAEEREK